MKPFQSNNRGIALLFVLGMLTLLLTLAVAFVAVVQQDRKSSLAGVGSVKAEILTEVAVKRAVQIIEATYMESVSGVPGGVHVRNPRNSANPAHLFYNANGSPNNLFVTSNAPGGTNATTEIQQLLGTYATGNNDIDNVASGGLNSLMRGNITATTQVPQWLRLGTTDARFCFFANDLSGFANHPVVVIESSSGSVTNFVPRLNRLNAVNGFGRDVREIDIPHHPNSHAEANFPLGAYYRNNWESIIPAGNTLRANIDPDNNQVMRPIDLDALQTNPPATMPAQFADAFKTIGLEYPTTAFASPIKGTPGSAPGLTSAVLASTGATVPPSRTTEIDILYNAFLDYIDADSVSQYADGKGPQTEAHPAINEVGAVVLIEKYEQQGVGTNEWTVRLYGNMETHYPYYNAPAGPYTVSASAVSATLSLDGTPVYTQSAAPFSENVSYSTFGQASGNYRLHSLVNENGNPYARVVFTNTTPDIDISYQVSVTQPTISIGGVIVDTVLDTTGTAVPIVAAYTTSGQAPAITPGPGQAANTRIPGSSVPAGGPGALVPAEDGTKHEGGVSWTVKDPRFNWSFGGPDQWEFTEDGGGFANPGVRPSMGYLLATMAARQGAVNFNTKVLQNKTRNDKDVGTFVKNGKMETVGELGFLPYTSVNTISLRKRSAVGKNGRYHPVWNYFTMQDPLTPQKYYLNPNSNHFFYNNGNASQRTTTFLFNGMRVGPTVDPTVTTGGGTTLLEGSTIAAAQAIALANRLADSPAFTPGFQSAPPYTASGQPNDRAYFANVADIPLHMTFASTDPGFASMKENEIESYHINCFDLMHTRNNVYALNILISTTHGLRHVFAEVWRDPFAPQSGGWHDTYPLIVTSPSIFD